MPEVRKPFYIIQLYIIRCTNLFHFCCRLYEQGVEKRNPLDCEIQIGQYTVVTHGIIVNWKRLFCYLGKTVEASQVNCRIVDWYVKLSYKQEKRKAGRSKINLMSCLFLISWVSFLVDCSEQLLFPSFMLLAIQLSSWFCSCRIRTTPYPYVRSLVTYRAFLIWPGI